MIVLTVVYTVFIVTLHGLSQWFCSFIYLIWFNFLHHE